MVDDEYLVLVVFSCPESLCLIKHLSIGVTYQLRDEVACMHNYGVASMLAQGSYLRLVIQYIDCWLNQLDILVCPCIPLRKSELFCRGCGSSFITFYRGSLATNRTAFNPVRQSNVDPILL